MEDIKKKRHAFKRTKNGSIMTLIVKYYDIILSRCSAVLLKFKFVKQKKNNENWKEKALRKYRFVFNPFVKLFFGFVKNLNC